ncbi:MAG: hypothetical protein RQ842_08165 [Vulcanisaeta sp.]|nr:hypothetical protein [Vulcanisaeta sp.]
MKFTAGIAAHPSIRKAGGICKAGKPGLRWLGMAVGRRVRIEDIKEKALALAGALESLEDDIGRRRYHEAYRRVKFALADAKELLELLEEYDPCVDCGGR